LILPIENQTVLFQNAVEAVAKKEKNYPKCVPIAKARSMSPGQRKSAVARNKLYLTKDQNHQELQPFLLKKWAEED
jgi:hypothetical protein